MLTQQDLNEIGNLIVEKLDEKTKLLPTKDEFFNKMDIVIGELKTIREEHVLQGNTVSDHSDQLDNHEKRIEHLEHPSSQPGA
jgi:predicted nuclease with TOPRIM domain